MVLDLRTNGGGSLTEAINLTGLFINDGPVVQVKDADGRVHALLRSRSGHRLERPAGRGHQQVQRQRQRDFRRGHPGLQPRPDRRRQVDPRQGHGAKPLEPGRAVVPHSQRPEHGRTEDHDAAVLPARRRQHAAPRRGLGHRAAVVEHAPGRGRGRPGLSLALRPGAGPALQEVRPREPRRWSISSIGFRPPAARLRRSSRRSSGTSPITSSRRPRRRSRSTRPSSSRSGPS